jgi:hypothetical protein
MKHASTLAPTCHGLSYQLWEEVHVDRKQHHTMQTAAVRTSRDHKPALLCF